jgi:hypothetical protein
MEFNVLKKSGLVVFDGEVVVGVTFPDHIVGNFALSQKSIGGDILALNINGIKQGDCGLDFVGALNLLVGYGQVAYFFWV